MEKHAINPLVVGKLSLNLLLYTNDYKNL